MKAHHLPPDVLKKRDVVHIDIAHDHVKSSDYKLETDPTKFKSQKTGRGPLTSPNWMSEVKPVMTCYKLVTAKFKWRFLPFSIEKMIHTVRHAILLLVAIHLLLYSLASSFSSTSTSISTSTLYGYYTRRTYCNLLLPEYINWFCSWPVA